MLALLLPYPTIERFKQNIAASFTFYREDSDNDNLTCRA